MLLCPMTKSVEGAELFWKGTGKRRMRLLPASATYRFPLESTANAVGRLSPAVVPGPWGNEENISPCPITMSATPQVDGEFVPQAESLSGLRHASTRLLPVSARYMMGGETLKSKAMLAGVFSSRPSIRLGAIEVMR